MFLLTEPKQECIRKFISQHATTPFSYAEVGCTRSEPPRGYIIDHNRVQLGKGAETYERAVAALKEWKQFDLDWVHIEPPGISIMADAIATICTRHFGFWALNACRVVYVIREEKPVRKFGFAYGTLLGHAERGEERFTIEWHADDSVWFDILAYSRPGKLLVFLGFPLARLLQKRFAKQSLRNMVHWAQQGELQASSNAIRGQRSDVPKPGAST
jgi:uncharacterized protein (UPF0548 family)